MKRLTAVSVLLWAVLWAGLGAWGVANNPNNPNALTIQGPDPTGNLGYPLAVVGASGGDPVTIAGTVTATIVNPLPVSQSGTWTVQPGNTANTTAWKVDGSAVTQPVSGTFWQATQPVSGTVTANQGTSPWVVAGSTTPADTFTTPTTAVASETFPMTFNGTTWDRARSVNSAVGTSGTGVPSSGMLMFDDVANIYRRPTNAGGTTDGGSNQNSQAVVTLDYNGATWDRHRSPNVCKTVQATLAGNTALWTPTAGKKFRLMRYLVEVTENATVGVAGVLTITFQDGAGAVNLAHDVWVPGAALATAGDLYTSGWIDLGSGILSAAANNVLNVNLSVALTAGNVRVIACGTEG